MSTDKEDTSFSSLQQNGRRKPLCHYHLLIIQSDQQSKQSQLEGVGPVIASELKTILQDSTLSGEPPPSGKLPSTGSALLVALLIGTEEERKRGSSDIPLVGEDKLKEYCEQLSEEKFNTKSYAVDGSSVLCPAWWRITVLISRGLVKKRTRGMIDGYEMITISCGTNQKARSSIIRGKRPVYQLLPDGEELALNIRGDDHHVPRPLLSSVAAATNGRQVGSIHPQVLEQSTPVHPASHGKATNSQSDALYSNDDGLDGVLLLVDRHELGGDRVGLGELSRRLSEWDVLHRTSPLPCGDYMWKWRHNGKETTLPVLMERKRADDLAGSIKDGRYFNQKEKMLKWKKDFGVISGDVSLQYVVESEPAAYRVACTDGCNGVGKCGNPTVEQVEAAISELEESVDFQLLKTRNIEGTVELLASITAELIQRVNKGEFEALKYLPGTHTKSRSKGSKVKHSVGADYGLNSCTSPVYSHSSSLSTSIDSGTLHGGTSSSVGRSPRGKHFYDVIKEGTPESPSRKRPRYKAIKLDDLTETTTQASLPKKKRNSSKTSTTTSFYDSDSDEDLVLETPVFNPNTSRSVLDKVETRYESDRYRLNVDGQCSSHALATSPHISSDWSDSDDDLPPSGIGIWDDRPFKYSSSESTPETRTSQFNLGQQTEPMSQISKFIAQSKSIEESDDAKITMLKDVLPDSSLEDIITALSSAGGSVQKVIMERVNSTETKASELVGSHSPRYSPLSKYTAVTKDLTTTSNSLHRVEDSDDAKIAAVQSALPGSSLEEVIAALTSAGGNVEQAIIEAVNSSESDISRKLGEHSTTQLSRVAEEIKTLSVPTASNPSYNVKSSGDAGKIAAIQDVLPDSSLENIVTALSSSKGDVEQAIMEVVNNSKMEHSRITSGNPAGRCSPKSNESLVSKGKTESCSLEHFDDAKIALVQDVLPDASMENVIAALNMTGGNVEQAILESVKISETEVQALDEYNSLPRSLPLSEKTLVSKKAPVSIVARCSSDNVKYSDGSNIASVRDVLPDTSCYNAITALNKSGANMEQVILDSEGFDDNYSSPTWSPLSNETVLSKRPLSSITSDYANSSAKHSEDVKIAAVRDVLPDASVETVVRALNIAEGNVEQAIMELLDTPKRSVKQNSSTSGAKCRPSCSNEVIDLT